MSVILYSLCAADGRRHYSPHVWKIIMALRHKGVRAEVRPVSFADIAAIEDGSFKSVPVLNDNGHLEGDSFEIAVHLERAYPDGPTLFGGPGGQAMARFVESFSQAVIHPPVSAVAAMDMHALMSPADQAYFRAAREKRFGMTLEQAAATREVELAALPAKFAPLRGVLAKQPWLGGQQPLFADYILFGVLQWARITLPHALLPADDPVSAWFERCLDLHGGVGRSVTLSDH
ncbi:glutathione S-transferase [Duganella sp. 1411]|jgi:glutathione S-transferase|uniref:glutathione S-transferase family protein n=1 Tax=Duganella sp. 1411 TaxID=2806572 RepID=UPI001AE4299E|nr:glutathione S-transferase family protein [Duganella sp. 1411]MBP1205056.1 glutathione S-transferase [Duganella sp. 1411]